MRIFLQAVAMAALVWVGPAEAASKSERPKLSRVRGEPRTAATPVHISKKKTLYISPKANQAPQFNPCTKGFELSVAVSPAQGGVLDQSEGSRIGFSLKFSPAPGRGVASIAHIDRQSEFSTEDCGSWQKQYWPLLQTVLTQSRYDDRSGVVCNNVATIKLKVGTEREKTTLVCIGNSKEDSLAYAFQRFYEGGDALAAR